jgi:hypothetical protein
VATIALSHISQELKQASSFSLGRCKRTAYSGKQGPHYISGSHPFCPFVHTSISACD